MLADWTIMVGRVDGCRCGCGGLRRDTGAREGWKGWKRLMGGLKGKVDEDSCAALVFVHEAVHELLVDCNWLERDDARGEYKKRKLTGQEGRESGGGRQILGALST